MGVAAWCYKWMGWMDGSPGRVKYRAFYGARNRRGSYRGKGGGRKKRKKRDF